MKTVLLVITIISLFLVGCSATYVASKFKSNEDFEKHFNKYAGNQNLDVITVDNKIINLDGAKVNNDSLSTNITEYKVDSAEIPLSEIGYIAYKNANYTSVHIMLSNGNSIDADNMKFLSSSLKYNTKEDVLLNKNILLNSIKEVNYKTHTVSAIEGVLCGIVGGFLLTISKIIPASIRDGNPPYPDDYDYAGVGIGSITLGILAGGITGYFVGHSYHYEFNQ